MQNDQLCPHCGKALDVPTTSDYAASTPRVATAEVSETTPTTNSDEQVMDAIVAEATKKVIREVMTKIQPLLEKLSEAAQGKPVQQQSAPADPVEKLKSIQAAAQERMKQQEQRIAARMQKLHQRISKQS